MLLAWRIVRYRYSFTLFIDCEFGAGEVIKVNQPLFSGRKGCSVLRLLGSRKSTAMLTRQFLIASGSIIKNTMTGPCISVN